MYLYIDIYIWELGNKRAPWNHIYIYMYIYISSRVLQAKAFF